MRLKVRIGLLSMLVFFQALALRPTANAQTPPPGPGTLAINAGHFRSAEAVINDMGLFCRHVSEYPRFVRNVSQETLPNGTRITINEVYICSREPVIFTAGGFIKFIDLNQFFYLQSFERTRRRKS
jgi:hypothetical protein